MNTLSPPVPKKTRLPVFRRLAVDAAGLAELLSVGLRHVRTLDAGGKLPPAIALGTRKLWPMASIRRWLAWGAPDKETFLRLEAEAQARKEGGPR